MRRSFFSSLFSLIIMAVICFFFLYLFVPTAAERYFGVSRRGTAEQQISAEADSLSSVTAGMTNDQISNYLENLDTEELEKFGVFAKDTSERLIRMLSNSEFRKKAAKAIEKGGDELGDLLKESVH
ncbi:MAG: hypothetical protein K6G51_06870 [Sphaerochaetaceae bacterium]|nr:hypothetical protein [Sphaerochaetaceae bacterium]